MLASLGSSTMGAAGSVLSRALDAELCRSGGAVQVVGVERGERGERLRVRVRVRVRVMDRVVAILRLGLGLGLGLESRFG